MKNKHKRSLIEALLAVQTAPVQKVAVPYERGTGLQKFAREYAAQQAAEEQARKTEAERPIRKLEEEHSRLLRELIDADILAGLDTESSFLAATCPTIGDGSQFDGISPEAIRATIRRALSEFEDSIAHEVRLTESGRAKLHRLSRANLGIDWTKSSAWTQAYYLLNAADQLTLDDLVEAPEAHVAQPTRTFDDVLSSTNGETREGQKALRAAAMRDYQKQVVEWHNAWVDSVWRAFRWIPTDEETKFVTNYMSAHNLSPLAAKSWDAGRVALAKRFQRTDILYDVEKLDALISETDFSKDDFTTKQEIRRRERLIMGG